MKEKELLHICTQIRKIRNKKGLTQQNVADRLKISQNAYYKIEAGKTRLPLVTVLLLTDIFEVSLYDFFSEKRKR